MLVLCRHDTLVAWDLFRYDLSGTKRSLKLFPGLEFGYDTLNGYSTLDEANREQQSTPSTSTCLGENRKWDPPTNAAGQALYYRKDRIGPFFHWK
jgi:hypothetical protein